MMATPGQAPESNIEREVKLDVGLRFSLPDLTGVGPGVVAVALPDAKLQAIYVDTDDLRLMRWGITLRYRRDAVGGAGAEAGWTLKLPGAADGVALVRRELSWPGSFGPVPPEVQSLVRASARSAPLAPVAKLTTQRRRVELRDDSGRRLIEIDDDVVSVLDGRRLAARFRQVEVEAAPDAPQDLLLETVARLVQVGAIPGDDRPKVVRAIGPRATLGPDVVIPALDHRSPLSDVVAASIASGLSRMIRHDPGVRLGDDPEHVHQARVGTRRLRSDLRTFRSVLDGNWLVSIRDELGWLADALGEVRDADVLTERLRAKIAGLPDGDVRPAAALMRRLANQRNEARTRLLAALDGDRYISLLDRLAQAAADPPLAAPKLPVEATVAVGSLVRVGPAGASEGPDGPTDSNGRVFDGSATNGSSPGAQAPGAQAREEPVPAAEPAPADLPAVVVLPRLVRRPWRHLRLAVEALGDDPPDEALHDVRIQAKRLRYAAEAAAPVVGRPARRLASAVAEVQGALGDMHDAVVAEEWLRQAARSAPAPTALVAGELITLERAEQQVGRDTWAKPWKRASAKPMRSWLKR
jgi:CHAD domain-containing protein